MSTQMNDKQKSYFDERVEFFSGMGIAIPYGLIQDAALKMSDEDVDKWFEEPIPKQSKTKQK